jgi:hypothetical protein
MTTTPASTPTNDSGYPRIPAKTLEILEHLDSGYPRIPAKTLEILEHLDAAAGAATYDATCGVFEMIEDCRLAVAKKLGVEVEPYGGE